MNKETFCNVVYALAEEQLLHMGLEVRRETVYKEQDQAFDGILVKSADKNYGTALYLDDYYADFEQGKIDIEQAVSSLVHSAAQYSKKENYTAEGAAGMIRDNSICKEKLFVKLLDPDLNKAYIKANQENVYVRCGGYLGQFCLDMGHGSGTEISAAVTEGLLKSWDVTVEQLYKDAVALMRKNAVLWDMYAIASARLEDRNPINYLHTDMPYEIYEDRVPMLLLTTQENRYGASVIIDPAVLKKTASVVGSDFYLIPSSVHEMLVIPCSCSIMNTEILKAMVIDGNAKVTKKDDILGDKIHKYNAKEGKMILLK